MFCYNFERPAALARLRYLGRDSKKMTAQHQYAVGDNVRGGKRSMTDFNYAMPGEFYSRKSQGTKPTGLTYQRFKTAAEAIRFAIEALPSAAFAGCMLEANGGRFGAKELRALYASSRYPLRRAPPDHGARKAN